MRAASVPAGRVSPPPRRSWPGRRPPWAARMPTEGVSGRCEGGGATPTRSSATKRCRPATSRPASSRRSSRWASQPTSPSSRWRRSSGGQEARVALAAILLARFDLTLLDEPTNDLDFDGLARLEDMVARRRRRHGHRLARPRLPRPHGDRRPRAGRAHPAAGAVYGGGWAATWPSAPPTRPHAAEDYAVYESQRAELRRRAQRERQWATSGVAREKKHPARQRQGAARLPHQPDREAGVTGAAHRARARRAGGGGEAVGGMGPALHHQRGGAVG